MLETIKSYLVSLGFAVNDSEFNKVNSALNDFNKNVVATTSNMIKSKCSSGGSSRNIFERTNADNGRNPLR